MKTFTAGAWKGGMGMMRCGGYQCPFGPFWKHTGHLTTGWVIGWLVSGVFFICWLFPLGKKLSAFPKISGP